MIFGHNCFICEPIYKLFVAPIRTHELQEDDMVIFVLWCFRFRKMQFLKDGVETVIIGIEQAMKIDYLRNFIISPHCLQFLRQLGLSVKGLGCLRPDFGLRIC